MAGSDRAPSEGRYNKCRVRSVRCFRLLTLGLFAALSAGAALLSPSRVIAGEDAAVASGAAVEAQHAQPPTSLSPPSTIVVEGRWRGIVYEGGNRFTADFRLRQFGSLVRGSVTEDRISGSGHGEYSITGQISPEGVTYQADNWASTRPPGWCLPAGSLRYSRADGREYLAGRLRRNSVSGGCSSRRQNLGANPGANPGANRQAAQSAQGRLDSARRSDRGRVRAHCSGNSTAGACPRNGYGTIRLEREIPDSR